MRVALSFLVGLGVVVASACGDAPVIASESCDVAFGVTSAQLATGELADLAATAHCTRSTPTLTYSSSAPNVVGVDPVSGRLVGMGVGSAVITVRVAGVSGATATLPVTVVCGPYLVAPSVRPPSFTVVPGGVVQVAVDYVASPCATAADTTFVFALSDSTLGTITSTGRMTARTQAASRAGYIIVTALGRPAVRIMVPVVVSAPLLPIELTVSPESLSLTTADTARLRWTVTLWPEADQRTSKAVLFRSSDSCVARVSADGLVWAGGSPGQKATITTSLAAYQVITQSIDVTIEQPNTRRAFLLALTSDTLGTPIQPQGVQGTVFAKFDVPRWYIPSGRVELWLAGRLVTTIPLARPQPGEALTTIRMSVNTAARDALGHSLYPNGSQSIELRAIADAGGIFAGCPAGGVPQSGGATQAVTLANP